MKKTIIVLSVVLALFVCSYGAYNLFADAANPALEPPAYEALYDYLNFEDALTEYATDIVVVQYIDQKPFGDTLTEYEFAVQERILGDAADRIFVYAERRTNDAIVVGGESEIHFNPGDLAFSSKTEYLLPLMKIISPYAKTHEDGFTFIRDIVVNTSDPTKSTMYGESLSKHSTGLYFSEKNASRQQITSYASQLTRNNPLARDFIRSERMTDIINESLFALVVEINEPLRLSEEQATTDWMATDIYYATVVQSVKGNAGVGDKIVVIFPADTVQQGEKHIVAVEPISEGSDWYEFTSKNSLIQMEKLNEIKAYTIER